MIDTVKTFIKRHTLLQKDTTVLVGVSGGPDSVALLSLLKNLQKEYELHIIAITIDHQLRGNVSHLDSMYVEQLCKEWNIDCEHIDLDVASYKEETGLGTQVACRHLRYEAFAAEMKRYGGDYLALGHHADDQAETLLMQFSKAASSSGIKGIPVRRMFAGGEIIRPLLAVNKQEILTYLKENKIEYKTDATNAETDYTRNAFRHHVFPIIKEKNPNIHQTAQYLSETIHEDENYLLTEAKRVVDKAVTFFLGPKSAQFKIETFKSYPIPLQRRAFHLILDYLYDGQNIRLSYTHEIDFFAILKEVKGNVTIDLPRQLKMMRVYEDIVFTFRENINLRKPIATELNIPGVTQFSNGSYIEGFRNCDLLKEDKNTYIFSLDAYTLPLFIRTPLAGDRMYFKGLQGRKKLSRIFIDEKIPRHLRDSWPVVVDNTGEVIWLIGLKKSTWIENTTTEKCIGLRYEKLKKSHIDCENLS